jgi:transketolase
MSPSHLARLERLEKRINKLEGRYVFGSVLAELGGQDERIVLVTADQIGTHGGRTFEKHFPNRCFNLGISEQNSIGVAAGLALSGRIPVVLLYGFLMARCAEQIRDDLCYPGLNTKIVTTSSGLAMGPGGVTHHCTEDLAILRSFAGLTIVQPGSRLETALATEEIVGRMEGPAYLRLYRGFYPENAEEALAAYYKKAGCFQAGRALTLRPGGDVCLIASGLTLGPTLEAATELDQDGIQARVLNLHTIKPLDVEAITAAATETRGIVVIEDHNRMGGLGEAVAASAAEFSPCPVLRVGVKDCFSAVGPMESLWERQGITTSEIIRQAEAILKGEIHAC